MLEDVICPSCGFRNPPDAENCAACNFPLKRAAGEGVTEPSRAEQASATGVPTYAPRRMRRPPRGPAPLQGQAMWLWLLFGTFAAVVLIATAVQTFRKQNAPPAAPPVEGVSPEQQAVVNSARAELARDSSNVEAHLALANVLYDTGNWDQAIVEYRSVLRRDSTRVPPMVDLGVCYYNLGDTPHAEELFHHALQLDPGQPVALFNLGIVAERHGHWDEALRWYHQAMEHATDAGLRESIAQALQRTATKAGRKPPPLPQGGASAGGAGTP
jgi:tetratricopeptide (TPR) repeat protein